jgi:hypothetical protein
MTRVQARRTQDGSERVELDGLSVGLSDVVALHFEDARSGIEWYIGKVQKMFKLERTTKRSIIIWMSALSRLAMIMSS